MAIWVLKFKHCVKCGHKSPNLATQKTRRIFLQCPACTFVRFFLDLAFQASLNRRSNYLKHLNEPYWIIDTLHWTFYNRLPSVAWDATPKLTESSGFLPFTVMILHLTGKTLGTITINDSILTTCINPPNSKAKHGGVMSALSAITV